jgi:hypothetical protein
MPTSKVIPTGTVLAGCTSIGVYFCADWCGPCTMFTPILKQYYDERRACKGMNRVDSFEVILVLQCRTAATTEHLFLTMPWPAVPHIDLVGPRGDSLMSLYGITTLPALVLLDGTGAVVCQDGHAKVVNRQAGWGSTPTNPWQPIPDCDLPAVARQRPTRVHLPLDPRLDLRRAARPPGVPPAFNETGRDSQAMASRVGRQPTTPPDAAERQGASTRTNGDTLANAPSSLRPPKKGSKKRPPPKPNLPQRQVPPKRPKVTFSSAASTLT